MSQSVLRQTLYRDSCHDSGRGTYRYTHFNFEGQRKLPNSNQSNCHMQQIHAQHARHNRPIRPQTNLKVAHASLIDLGNDPLLVADDQHCNFSCTEYGPIPKILHDLSLCNSKRNAISTSHWSCSRFRLKVDVWHLSYFQHHAPRKPSRGRFAFSQHRAPSHYGLQGSSCCVGIRS